MAALGDSVTSAMLAIPSPHYSENKKTYSWASGEKIQSHFMLLRKIVKAQDPGSDLAILNVSVPGTGVAGLTAQLNQVAKELATGKYAGLKYVTILSGNNNLCSANSGTQASDQSFYFYFKQALKKIDSLAGAEPVRVLVSSIAKTPDLMLSEIRNFSIEPWVKCGFLQLKVLHYCDVMLDWKDPKDYEAKIQIVERKNAILKRSVEEASREFSRIQAYFSEYLYNEKIRPTELAQDCFHPTARAQEMLSLALWKDQPFFH